MAQVLSTTNSVFPDENIDPKLKAKEKFLLEYAQAAFNAASHLPDEAIGYKSRERYAEITDYFLGRQSVDRYKSVLAMDQDPTAPDILITHRSVFKHIYKFVNIAIGLLEKAVGRILVDTIDADASIELKEQQDDRKGRLLLRQQFQLQGMPEMAEHPQVAKLPRDPDDLEDLEILAMGERHPITSDAQDSIRAVFNNNCEPEVRRQYITSLVNFGAAVTKDDTEPEGITLRCCDLSGVVMNYCTYSDFRDLKHIGEIRSIPVSSLEVMSGGKISREDLKLLYEQGNNKQWYRMAGIPSSFNAWYGTASIDILDLEIQSVDKIDREESRDSYGNLKYGNATKDEEKRKKKALKGAKFTSVPVQNIYRVKWIIGTDIVFDCGKKEWIKRNAKNPARALFSYHITAVGFDKMTAFSRTAALMPMADGIQMTAYRRQRAINKVKGTTYEMDVARLEGVDISAGGEGMTPFDLIELWKQEDIMVYRSRSINGKIEDAGGAIRSVAGGIGQELNEYRVLVSDYLTDMRDTIGLNSATDSTTPSPKLLNGVANLAAMGTNNALSDLFFATKRMRQMYSESVLIRVQDMVRHGRGDEIAAIIGRDSAKRLGKAPDLDKYHFGTTVEDDPSPEEDQQFTTALIEAVRGGQISVDEQFMAQSLYKENVRKGQLYLSYRVRKNKEAAIQKAQQDIAANGQQQQQSAQLTAQLEQQRLQIEFQLKSQLSAQEHAQKMEELTATGQYGLEKERIGGTARIAAADSQASERDTSNMRDNAARLIKEGKGDEVEALNPPNPSRNSVAPVTDADHPQLPVKTGFSFLSPIDKYQSQQPVEPQPEAESQEMEAQA